VFIFDVKNNPPEKIALAKNALKRAKTLRYPDCVKFIDGAETESQIIIGTEQVESLRSNLFNNLDLNLARLGLLKVASTIKFLSDDCQMIHGNIGVDSVFVTRSGEWKVGGFEVLYSIKDERSFLKTHQYLLPPDRITAPELDMERFVPTTAVDAWSFGCLIFHIFNGVNTLTRSALDNRGQIPMPLFRHYKSLIHQDPRARLSLEKFLAYTSGPGSYFDDDFIGTSLFLEQLALKDKAEKEQFLV
jgi:SCY1-like protein 1